MAAPVMSLGNTLHTSASLANSGTATDNLDASTYFEAQVMYKVTAGGSVAATFGMRIDVFELYSGSTYGNSSTGTAVPNFTYTVAGYSSGQIVYSPKIFVPTGKWLFKITNVDATNAVTVEAFADYVTSVQ